MGEVVPIKSGVKKLIGKTEPRIMSVPLKGKSKGQEFSDFADEIGMPLFPWQKFIADDFLSVDDEGMFRRKTCAIIIARQNGKTHLIALRILAEMFLWNPKGKILAMSSVRDLAEDTFEMVCGIIDRNPKLRARVKLSRAGKVGYFGNGSYYVDTVEGGRYEVVAASRDGSRGKTADLLFIDELREITEDAWAAAKPTTTARPNAQTYVTSNAGDAFSNTLNELRDRALSYPSPTLGWYEYSAPPHMKPNDRKGWAMANPSLGYTITEATLEENFSTLSSEKFRTEHLCQWVSSLSSPWPMGAFEDCSDKTWKPSPGAYTVFGFDVAKSRRTASLVAGQVTPDGRLGVAILQQWTSQVAVDDLKISADIKAWADKYNPQATMYDHYSTATIAQRLLVSGVACIDVSGQEFYQACGDLLDAIVAKRIIHTGQQELIDQMNACAAKENDSSWRIVRRSSAGDVSAPIALAMVVHKMVEPVAVPAIY